jgi:hypothetical protein
MPTNGTAPSRLKVRPGKENMEFTPNLAEALAIALR